MEISSVESENSPLYKIISPSGAVVWDSNMKVPPRQLNDVELAYLKFELMKNIYPKDTLDPSVGWYEGDIEKACEDVLRYKGGNLLETFSMIEIHARESAFYYYINENPNVFLIIDFTDYGELVVTDTSGVLTPFASDWAYHFFRSDDSHVNIEFSEDANMGFTFNRNVFGVAFLQIAVDFSYNPDVEIVSPRFSFFGRSLLSHFVDRSNSSPNVLNLRFLVDASSLVLTDSDVVDILNSKMSEN
jgi:hypothetical protein